jgi:hypothetical protein
MRLRAHVSGESGLLVVCLFFLEQIHRSVAHCWHPDRPQILMTRTVGKYLLFSQDYFATATNAAIHGEPVINVAIPGHR